MTQQPDHPPSYAVDRVSFADGTSLLLGFPLQRLGARILDWILAAVAAAVLTRLVLSGVDALWGCPGCPFLDPPPTAAAAAAEIPADAADGCPDVVPSREPDSCGPDRDPPDDTPQRTITETVETAIVLIGLALYDLLSMMVGDTGSSLGRKALGIRVVSAFSGGRLSRQAIMNRAAIQGLGLAVIVALNTLHTA